MAKDPAFLFYSSDFIVGTLTMSFEDRGKYIFLLAQMHQQGRMNEETIRLLVGLPSVNLKSKFEVDENGLWYNERLEKETEKRNKFTESRRINGLAGGRGNKSKANDKPNGKHMVKHMEDENENTNEDVIKVKEQTKELTFPFHSNEFINMWNMLIESKKWRSKTLNALQMSLKKLSKHNEQTAIKMIEDCIAGDWQGFVEPKNTQTDKPSKGDQNISITNNLIKGL